MVKPVTPCDLEEGLILAGLVLLSAGAWIVWGLGFALLASGVLLFGLGCVIAFGR